MFTESKDWGGPPVLRDVQMGWGQIGLNKQSIESFHPWKL